MAGIYSRGLRMIPIAEMTEVMKACTQMKESPVQPHQWVRVNKGPFEDDLGLVEQVIGSKEAIIRLIPRIPDFWLKNVILKLRSSELVCLDFSRASLVKYFYLFFLFTESSINSVILSNNLKVTGGYKIM